MKLREEQWLAERIDTWVAQDIITPQQAESIRAAESTRPKKRQLNFGVLAALGGLCIAAGIILIIAYNWERIPYGLRLSGYGLLVLLTAEAALRLPNRSRL